MDVTELRNKRLEICDDLRRMKEEFRKIKRAQAIAWSMLRGSMIRKPKIIGEIVLNSQTRQTGTVIRIVANSEIRVPDKFRRKPRGVSYVVSVPADSPERQALWHESDVEPITGRRGNC
jgi:hypothetical protein